MISRFEISGSDATRAGRHSGQWQCSRGTVDTGDPHRADRGRDRSRSTSALPADQRVSIRMFCPTIQPNWCSPDTNAAMRACPWGSSAASGMSTPMRRIRSDCCARAVSGHVAPTPTSSVMNSRRRLSNIGTASRARATTLSACTGAPASPWGGAELF